MSFIGMTLWFPSLGYAPCNEVIISPPLQNHSVDGYIVQVLDIVRASSFQKALDSTRRISATDPANTIPSAAFWVVFTDALSFLSIALPKLGVGILIIRLFRPRHWLKIAILSLCFVLNFLALVGFIITYVQCDPVAGQWDPFTHPQTVCWSRAVQIIYSLGLGGKYSRRVIYCMLS